MELLAWLKAIHSSIQETGKDHAMREFVTGLHKRDLMYHFDDCAVDCLHESNARIGKEEAELINKITSELHCEEMFEMAIQLLDEEVCVNCGNATPHRFCSGIEESE